MEPPKTLTYGPFSTEVIFTNEVKNFLQENNESTNILDFNSDEWYQSWLLKFLDKNKDGTPDEEFGKEFQLIYTNIIQSSEDYQDIEDILDELKVLKENIIFDGSKAIFKDLGSNPPKTKFWVRWVVVKK